MTWELIKASDYAGLPDDPYQKFVTIEAICRRSMNSLISESTPGDFDEMIRLQYMHIVAATADELGIAGAEYRESGEGSYKDLQWYTAKVAAVSARLMLRSPPADPYSVKLGNRTKGIIESKISSLREAVEKAQHLTPEKRKELLKRLEEFRTELHKDRVNFGKAFAFLTYVSVGLGAGVSFLAEAPNALQTVQEIIHLVGVDKQLEDAERDRLEGPKTPKALPSPQADSSHAAPKTSRFAQYEDADDIPF